MSWWGRGHRLCFASYPLIDSAPNASILDSLVGMEMGLFNSFSWPAGLMSAEGAGETLQKETRGFPPWLSRLV